MRVPFVPWLVLCTASAALAQSGPARSDQFPYSARITGGGAHVHSGPGESYYPTEKLSSGEKVEVYRHDPSGWLAIRPTQRSYSWVSRRFLEQTNDREIAVVTGQDVEIRIGSLLGRQRGVGHVRLRQGEKVELLEPEKFTKQISIDTWCKIAPPSGEFRWVHGKYVLPEQSGPSGSGPARNGTASGFPADFRLASNNGRKFSSQSQRDQNNRNTPGADSVGSALDELDLTLSAIVVEPPSRWSFASLQSEARQLIERAQTAVERGKVRLLMEKIERFASIKRRTDSVDQARNRTAREKTRRAANTISDLPGRDDFSATPSRLNWESNGRFDGAGRLIRVKSRRMGDPPYALVTANGKVVCFISPAPGTSLKSYLNRQIGVNGQKLYRQELKGQQVTAQRVTLLDGRKNR